MNYDNDFEDTGEMLFEGSGQTDVTGSITIPSSAQTGITWLRVSMKYNSYSDDPCETFDYGEVEDYSINIKSTEWD